MKRIYWVVIAIVIITLLVLLFSFINRDRMIDRMIEQQATNSQIKTEYLEDMEGIRVITLGTAAPVPSDRNQTGTAIFVGGHFFLFDAGYGVIREAENQNLPLSNLSAVFISHWHSDHFIDLPYAINRSWQLGRQNTLEVYAPVGIDTVMNGINLFLKYENEHRVAHHGEEVMNPKLQTAWSKQIDLKGRLSAIVFQDENVKITAFTACHEPIDPSYGFRIDYKGKSVVISGDTREKCNTVEDFAKDADLLLHESMLKDIFIKARDVNLALDNERIAHIVEDITEYHTTPEYIGILANRAGVKKVVLHHFAPVPSNLILSRRYQSDLRKNYKGPVSLAEDGSEYYIEVN